MGNRILLGVLTLLFLVNINLSFALTSDIKQEYNSLETVTVKIGGNIIEPITVDQIEFKRKNVAVPFEFDVNKIYQDYYIWFVTPKVENDTNYTLIIKNVYVQELGKNNKVNLSQDFSVIKNITDYYIKPGFVFTKDNYDITIISNKDEKMTLSVDFPAKEDLDILPGKNEFNFDTSEITTSIFKILKIGNYQIPIFLSKEGTISDIKNNSISVSPSYIEQEKEIGSKDLEYSFKVINIGGNIIEDLYLEYDDKFIKIAPEDKIDLNPGEEITYNITLENEINVSEVISIKAKKNNISREFEFKIDFVDFFVPVNYTLINQTVKDNSSDKYYCQEYGGKECYQNQNCSGQVMKTKGDVLCCIGKCELISDKQGNNSWIGYMIIAVAIIAIIFGLIKYKKVKPSKTLLEKTIEENNNIKKPMP